MEVDKTKIIEEFGMVDSQNDELIISDMDSFKEVSRSLSSDTRLKILELLSQGPLDISRIAKKLKQTEANISAQIQNLVKANLVTTEFQPGNHGIRKICSLKTKRIIMNLFN